MSNSCSTTTTRRWYSGYRQLVLLCLIGLGLTSCGGGMFGTGDGSDMVDAVGTSDTESDSAADTIVIVDADTNDTDAADNAAEATEPAEPVDADSASEISANTSSQTAVSLAFSNTTPSGTSVNASTVPAIKLVNLSNRELVLVVENNEQTDSELAVPAGSSSDNSLVNTGESRVTINNAENQGTGFQLAIDPLNASADSVTTVIIVGEDIDTINNQLAQPVTFAVLDTRVVSSVAGMAEVRVIDLGSVQNAGSASAPSYTLTNIDQDSGSTGLVFTFPENSLISPVPYSLINAGAYVLESSDPGFSPQTLSIASDSVLSIIISDNSETPVFLELDEPTAVQ